MCGWEVLLCWVYLWSVCECVCVSVCECVCECVGGRCCYVVFTYGVCVGEYGAGEYGGGVCDYLYPAPGGALSERTQI